MRNNRYVYTSGKRNQDEEPDQTILSMKNVSKSFYVRELKPHTFKEWAVAFSRGEATGLEHRVPVLQQISFSMKPGESVGIIGSNGCGKSTLLKLAAKILQPDEGSIVRTGSIAGLIELGAGFHADLTGRENLRLNAAIHGMSGKEIAQIEQAVIAFSELEEYIDRPVRTYSSGMILRLGFSCAIHVKAQLLLIDEILAVGDRQFQQKCIAKIRQLQEEGVSLLVVSHSMDLLQSICSRVIWLKDGRKFLDDSAEEVVYLYKNT